jgi:hypothetical protein
MDRCRSFCLPGDKRSRALVLTAQYHMQVSNASSKIVMDRRNVAGINARFLVDNTYL